jgi:hypothetical protein
MPEAFLILEFTFTLIPSHDPMTGRQGAHKAVIVRVCARPPSRRWTVVATFPRFSSGAGALRRDDLRKGGRTVHAVVWTVHTSA